MVSCSGLAALNAEARTCVAPSDASGDDID